VITLFSSGPYQVIFARSLSNSLKDSHSINFQQAHVGVGTVIFLNVTNNDITSETKMVAASSGLLKFFVIVIFLVGNFLTFGWIFIHSLKNKRMFKLLHIVKTSFPSSFVLPLDLKTSRYTFLATALVHFIILLPAIFLGGTSFIFIVTPIFGVVAAHMYSPLLGFIYMFMNMISILVNFSHLVSIVFSYCKYSTSNEASLCASVTMFGTLLYLIQIITFLLFEFIAYSFVYRLLRYKLWLTEQSIIQEPAEFEYHNMSEISSKQY